VDIKILTVDDNQANLDTLRFLINDIDFEDDVNLEVIEATNGNDALSIALKKNIALIILDIQMPIMDGFEVAKYLKKSSKTKDIPIVFLTAAFKSEEMREYGLHLGAFDYFLKPIDPLILVPKIKLYIHLYSITNELKNSNKILEQKIKDAIEQNSKMEAQLYEAEKLSSMGEMIGNIAHQWRQPLSVISTAATGVIVQHEFNMLKDTMLIESMETIDKNAQYLSKTIDDFRDFIKGDSDEKVVFNLKEEIEKCLDIENPILKQNNMEVILDLDESIEINSFPNGLVQSLINIINNSKDALKEKKEEKYIFITTKKNDKDIDIIIKDNGGGIPENIINKVFEPYFTTKHQSQGTGLGLHMTYNIIKDGLNGSISVKNTEYNYNGLDCKGAVFTIKLPI